MLVGGEMMRVVSCPECGGSHRSAYADAEGRPCDVCDEHGNVSARFARAYLAWALGESKAIRFCACGICGQERVCIETDAVWLCAECELEMVRLAEERQKRLAKLDDLVDMVRQS